MNPTVGNTITVREEEQTRLERLTAFLSAIQARQMTGSLTSFIDLTADYELRFGYGDNLTVLFPMNGDFTQSTYYLQQTLWTMDERGIPRNGTLDLTYGDSEAHLLPSGGCRTALRMWRRPRSPGLWSPPRLRIRKTRRHKERAMKRIRPMAE